jgi:FixJ family two-component response regulator
MNRVIHVDNSSFFRKVMRAFIMGLGLEYEGYERGEDAITAVSNARASCVITGLELPDMTGEKLIEWLIFSGLPMTIIAVTASDNDERIKGLEALGVKATIQKTGNWKERLREYF